MQFDNPDTATTPAACAKMFCATTRRIIAFTIRNVADDECVTLLDGIRSKLRAGETVMTEEQLTENIGSVLFKWAAKINARDESFFVQTSLSDLMSDVISNDAPDPQSLANHERLRRAFIHTTTARVRMTILDALSLMLILYARYRIQSK
jgi:hypothetical protein